MWEAESGFTCEIMLRPVEWAILPSVWLTPMGFCALFSFFIFTEKAISCKKESEWRIAEKKKAVRGGT